MHPENIRSIIGNDIEGAARKYAEQQVCSMHTARQLMAAWYGQLQLNDTLKELVAEWRAKAIEGDCHPEVHWCADILERKAVIR